MRVTKLEPWDLFMQSQRVVGQKGRAEIQLFEPPSLAEGEVLIRTRMSLISPGTERAFFWTAECGVSFGLSPL